jgi:hypothetical protein
MNNYVDTQLYEYKNPIEYLKTYFRNINKTDILDKILLETLNLNKNIFEYDDNINNFQLYDYIFLEYIQNRPKMEIIILWSNDIKKKNEYTLYIQKNCILNIIKKIRITLLGLQNLINEYYDIWDIDEINRKINELEINKNIYNEIYIFVYENINNIEIKKDQIIEIIKEKKIMIAQIFFHYQTLLYLQKRNIINFIDNGLSKSHTIFNNFIEFINNNFTILEKKRLILLSNSTFFITGIRNAYKIDFLFIDIHNDNIREKELYNIINNLLTNKSYLISHNYFSKLTNINNNFYNPFNIIINDFIFCVDYNMYFYYKGLKFLTLDTCIYFKLYRNNAYDYLDLLCLYKLYPGLTDIEIFIVKNLINNKNFNKKIKKRFNRYLKSDKKKIKISDILL